MSSLLLLTVGMGREGALVLLKSSRFAQDLADVHWND